MRYALSRRQLRTRAGGAATLLDYLALAGMLAAVAFSGMA